MTISTGLILRPEFRTQFDEGKEAPRGKSKTGGAPGTPATPGTPDKQATPKAPAGAPPCGTDMLLMLVLMGVVFYFFLLRPQQKQEKELKAMRSTLKKGDRVVTTGGMHAVVNSVQKDAVTLRPTADGPLMVFEASAIARVLADEKKAEDGGDGAAKIDNGRSGGGKS